MLEIQEYVHINEHKKERSSTKACKECECIFQIGKYQAFEEINLAFDFLPKPVVVFQDIILLQKTFFYKQENCSYYFNRPPPSAV